MNRYVITTASYIWADDDKKAKSLAGYIAGKQRKQYDNRCEVVSLKSADFGTFYGDNKNIVEGEYLWTKI